MTPKHSQPGIRGIGDSRPAGAHCRQRRFFRFGAALPIYSLTVERALAGKSGASNKTSSPEKFSIATRISTLVSGSYVPVFSRGSEGQAAFASALDPHCVAVLPFVNLSGAPAQDYLYQGITEAIINRLAGLPGLRVTARASAFRFSEAEPDISTVARNLGVGTIVHGSVRIFETQVRISVRIADANTRTWVWGRTFDCDLAALFTAEVQISEAVAGFLSVQLTEAWRTSRKAPSAEVYDLYLRGRHAWNQVTVEGCREAADYFTQAIALDSEFVDAYAGLADAYNWLMYFERRPPAELMAVTRRMALRAIQLDECCSEGYVALGTLTAIFEWDWEEGERLIRLGIDLRPSSVAAHVQGALVQLQRGNLEGARETLKGSSNWILCPCAAGET